MAPPRNTYTCVAVLGASNMEFDTSSTGAGQLERGRMFFTMQRQAHASDAIRARLSDVVLSGTPNLLSHPREESFSATSHTGA